MIYGSIVGSDSYIIIYILLYILLTSYAPPEIARVQSASYPIIRFLFSHAQYKILHLVLRLGLDDQATSKKLFRIGSCKNRAKFAFFLRSQCVSAASAGVSQVLEALACLKCWQCWRVL